MNSASTEKKTIDLRDLIALADNTSTGASLTLVHAGESWRIRLSKALVEALEDPDSVALYVTENGIIMVKGRGLTSELKVRKGGLIYSTTISKAIADAAGIELADQKSVRVGDHHTVKIEGDDTAVAVEITF